MSTTTKQQFVKNTNVPNEDSILWQLGNNWRYSAKSGDCYCPLKYNEEKELSDLTLFTAMMELLKKPVTELDHVEYSGMFFVPTKTTDGDPLLFVYEDEQAAKDKVANTKRFSGGGAGKTAGGGGIQTTIPRTTPTTTPKQNIQNQNSSNKYEISSVSTMITTFTDPQWVDAETAKGLEAGGYHHIPSNLAHPNTRIEDVHDGDQIVGERYLFLMGRIINVKISE